MVPANPPPIVRLTVIAEDFASNEISQVGEFPTADWYGLIEFEDRRVPVQAFRKGVIEQKATVDLRLDHDGNGKLTGQARGSWTLRTDVTETAPETCATRSIENGMAELAADLSGTYAAGTMSISVANDRSMPLIANWELARNCTLGGLSGEKGSNDYGSYMTIVGPILQYALMPSREGEFEFSYETSPGPGAQERLRVWLRPIVR
jgi:hypothetical protein